MALSRSTIQVIRQNLFWAFATNVLLIGRMGVLYPAFGITLNRRSPRARWRCRRSASSPTRCGCGRRHWRAT
jgi:hypothetical protein